MNIINNDNIEKSDLFPCYSLNLYKFLKDIKLIFPLNSKPLINIKNGKKYYEFVKCKRFQIALDEWRNNKIENTFVFDKKRGK